MSAAFALDDRVVHVVGNRRGRIHTLSGGHALVVFDSSPGFPSRVRLSDLRRESR